MAKKRKVGNLLALAVLTTMRDEPMHRYQIAARLKEWGKDRDLDIKWGSLYTVVQNLEKAGFLEIVGSEREGRRPERVIYRVTPAGVEEARDWTRELLAEPEPERSRYVAGLSILGVLPPDEVIALLAQRLTALEEQVVQVEREMAELEGVIWRLFLIETEYGLAMLRAEIEWTRALHAELTDGTFPGLDDWRKLYAGEGGSTAKTGP